MIDPLFARAPECLPGHPTDAVPGTERKILVMIERATRHEPLFHPLDNQSQGKDSGLLWAQLLNGRWAGAAPATAEAEECPAAELVGENLEIDLAVNEAEEADVISANGWKEVSYRL